jgi:hypothetical protein
MDKVFGMIPAGSGPIWFVAGISLILLAAIALLVFVGYSSKNIKFEVNDQGLRISSALYGRFIPRADIVTDGVKVIDLRVNTEYTPASKSNGSGLPGYNEGWFKLKNKEKALLFLTDRAHVVYVPTNKGYSVLMSVLESDEFAGLIRNLH